MNGDMERIREALHFIDASDRDIWLRMGMAIKSEMGDAGFDLWEAWSQQADSFNGKDAQDVWKSIRAGGGVSIGTLFFEAKANGWRDEGMRQKPTPEELAKRQRKAAERAKKEEAEIARERARTAAKAAAILQAATEAKADHPYLVRKQVSPVAALQEIDAGAAAAILGYIPKSGGEPLTGRLLMVPVEQGDRLSTVELIDGDGRKAALAGRGSKTGGYWATERLPEGDGAGLTLLIGEGVATALSAKEASGHSAIAALSAGNLPAVAKAMRERYPAAALVMLADLIKATGGPDPHAVAAAQAVGGKLAVPDFGSDRNPGATDFNDMAAACGAEAVARAIATAIPAIPAIPATDGWPEPQPLDEATLTEDDLRLLGALRVIPKDARSGKHSATRVIGWGLNHCDSGIDEAVGLALATEWDRITGGDAAGVFRDSDPHYAATQPVTVASIYDLAKQHGWTGEIPWRKPQPLTARIEPEPYPLDALPEAIRAAVEEVRAFVKAPLPMMASSALAALSLAIQAHTDAQRAEMLDGPVGLFLLTIADSGERKSTCDGFFTKAIRDYEEAQAQAAKPILKDYKADIEAWEAKRGGIKEKIRQLAKEQKPTATMESALRDLEHAKPEPPRIPRLLYVDATPEALAYGLAKQWPSGGVVSAEAGIVFGSHGMGKDSVMRNLGLLNQLWDGKSLTIDRRTTESFTVRGARGAVDRGLASSGTDLARILRPIRGAGAGHGLSGPVPCGMAGIHSRATAIHRSPGELAGIGGFQPTHCHDPQSTGTPR